MASNFSAQLFKGFIRSTVNQVGRDTGRVISNKIYGNAHAVRSKSVSVASPDIDSVGLFSAEGEVKVFDPTIGVSEQWIRSNFIPRIYRTDLVITFLILGVGIFLPVAIELYLLIKAISAFTKSEIAYRGKQVSISSSQIVSTEPVEYILPVKDEKNQLILKGFFALAIMICYLAYHYFKYKTFIISMF